MKILIIGAGAMGGLFGAFLATLADVCLITTNRAHADAISKNGVLFTDMAGNTASAFVRAITDLAHYRQRADLVLIFTKAGATQAAAHTAKSVLADDGIVLTLQNGLGNLEQIAAVVGPQRTTAGTTAQAATLLGPGHVRHAGLGPTVLAPAKGFSAQMQQLASIAGLFNQAGIATSITENIDVLLWSKLIVNVGINALTALLRIPNGALLQSPACQALMQEAVDEALSVAKALNITLDLTHQQERVRQVCELTRNNRASMLQDILRNRTTEIDVINGAIVAQGVAAGIPTPVNQMLTRLIKALESTSAQRIDAV
ncbi:MAG: 2-dehydropantoate 2-reductase [Desulfobulbus sp.]|nr:2-dehydropantoate 2-reductase [Desulfobulbus sp.]